MADQQAVHVVGLVPEEVLAVLAVLAVLEERLALCTCSTRSMPNSLATVVRSWFDGNTMRVS